MMATGFASLDKEGAIDVRSVAPTKTGVMVNALMTAGYPIPPQFTEEMLAACYEAMPNKPEIVSISIIPDEGGGNN